jgi:two-component sensor histidine kinase
MLRGVKSMGRSSPSGAGAHFRSLVLVEEITHRVVNEYAMAIGRLGLAASSAAPQARPALAAAAERLHAQAAAHRALRPPVDATVMDLCEYLANICAALSAAYLADRGVRLTLIQQPAPLEAERCWYVGLIMAELIANVARHGFAGGGGSATIELDVGPDLVSCHISNDGRADPDRRPGCGSRIIQSLAAELGGAVSWRFGPGGCVASLTFPALWPGSPSGCGIAGRRAPDRAARR